MTDKEKEPQDGSEIIVSDDEPEIISLYDDNGNEFKFEIIGACVDRGSQYFAVIPEGSADEEGDFEEFIIYKQITNEDGTRDLVEIEDDDEFERIAGKFSDAFDCEISYD
jgi:uncharacterized protein YrzB (UPF0473 family)